jgi:hypothetical protein
VANLNVQLSGATLQVLDNSVSVQRVNSPIATPVAQVTADGYYSYYLVANPGPASVVLPAATVWTVFVRNISGSNTISITLTPTGGAAWGSPYVLAPSGIFLSIVSYSTNPSAGGFTAMSLGSSGAGTYAEILLAA